MKIPKSLSKLLQNKLLQKIFIIILIVGISIGFYSLNPFIKKNANLINLSNLNNQQKKIAIQYWEKNTKDSKHDDFNNLLKKKFFEILKKAHNDQTVNTVFKKLEFNINHEQQKMYIWLPDEQKNCSNMEILDYTIEDSRIDLTNLVLSKPLTLQWNETDTKIKNTLLQEIQSQTQLILQKKQISTPPNLTITDLQSEIMMEIDEDQQTITIKPQPESRYFKNFTTFKINFIDNRFDLTQLANYPVEFNLKNTFQHIKNKLIQLIQNNTNINPKISVKDLDLFIELEKKQIKLISKLKSQYFKNSCVWDLEVEHDQRYNLANLSSINQNSELTTPIMSSENMVKNLLEQIVSYLKPKIPEINLDKILANVECLDNFKQKTLTMTAFENNPYFKNHIILNFNFQPIDITTINLKNNTFSWQDSAEIIKKSVLTDIKNQIDYKEKNLTNDLLLEWDDRNQSLNVSAIPGSYYFKNHKTFPLIIEDPRFDLATTVFDKPTFLKKDITEDLVKNYFLTLLQKQPNLSNLSTKDITLTLDLPNNTIKIVATANNLYIKNQNTFTWKVFSPPTTDLQEIAINKMELDLKIFNHDDLISQQILKKITQIPKFANLSLENITISIETTKIDNQILKEFVLITPKNIDSDIINFKRIEITFN